MPGKMTDSSFPSALRQPCAVGAGTGEAGAVEVSGCEIGFLEIGYGADVFEAPEVPLITGVMFQDGDMIGISHSHWVGKQPPRG